MPSSTSNDDDIAADVGVNGDGFNSVLLGKILAELTLRHDGLITNFLDALDALEEPIATRNALDKLRRPLVLLCKYN
jgi:hypothetical protein